MPEKELELGSIVSPLRYDILVRADFFRFLDTNLDIYHADAAEFLFRARQHPYFVWFTALALPREAHPPRGESEVIMAFWKRLQRTYRLYSAVKAKGFNSDHPVIIRKPKTVQPTLTGKTVHRDLFVTDGCHRLALMRFLGMTSIPASLYRIAPVKDPFTPLDNTFPLMRALRPAPDVYARFLSESYGRRLVDDLAGLRKDVAAHRPDQLAEYDSVVAIDSSVLEEGGPCATS